MCQGGGRPGATTPFPISFERCESFRLRRRHHPFVLRAEEEVQPLIALRQQIRMQMACAGFTATPRFTPHITLFWADHCAEPNPIAPIRWTVADFVLIASLPGRSRHIHLARWQLQ